MDTDLLKLLIERTSYINTYWNFYIVVATAIIGIVASGKIHVTRNIRIILTAIFMIFTLSNLSAIITINKQRTAISDLVLEEYPTITATLKPNPWWCYLVFHLLLDISVLISIWRIKSNNEDNHKTKNANQCKSDGNYKVDP